MKNARYVIVKYLPDVLEGEPIPIGVIMQSRSMIKCMFPEEAINKVRESYPAHVDAAALEVLPDYFDTLFKREKVTARTPYGGASVAPTHPSYLESLHWEPSLNLMFTKPASIELEEDVAEQFDQALNNLVTAHIRW